MEMSRVTIMGRVVLVRWIGPAGVDFGLTAWTAVAASCTISPTWLAYNWRASSTTATSYNFTSNTRSNIVAGGWCRCASWSMEPYERAQYGHWAFLSDGQDNSFVAHSIATSWPAIRMGAGARGSTKPTTGRVDNTLDAAIASSAPSRQATPNRRDSRPTLSASVTGIMQRGQKSRSCGLGCLCVTNRFVWPDTRI